MRARLPLFLLVAALPAFASGGLSFPLASARSTPTWPGLRAGRARWRWGSSTRSSA